MFFKFARLVLGPLSYLFFGIQYEGSTDLPEGPVMILANHRSVWDPILISIILRGRPIHWMAKKELYDRKLLGGLLHALGVYPVDRSGTDIASIKKSLKYLKAGEVVGVFPEGTRVFHNPDYSQAKSGVLSIAAKGGATIVPFYITGTIRPFGHVLIERREDIHLPEGKMSKEEYGQAMVAIMANIYEGANFYGSLSGR